MMPDRYAEQSRAIRTIPHPAVDSDVQHLRTVIHNEHIADLRDLDVVLRPI